jgi:23S rRNA (uridine2552-2'-O)-methyltransferase
MSAGSGSGSGSGGDDGKRRWTGLGVREGSSGRQTGERKVTARNAEKESSRRWIERQLADPYVRAAKDQGYRSRAAFKLKEIDAQAGLLRRGLRVVDLGAAPGGWVQVVLESGPAALVGIDLLPIEPLPGATLILGDVNDPVAVQAVLDALGGPPDLVLSDMAANTTGHRTTDHLRTTALVEMAVDFAVSQLSEGGAFCSKVFQGGTTGALLETLKQNFASVRHVKPKASRQESPEVYVVAKGFRRVRQP